MRVSSRTIYSMGSEFILTLILEQFMMENSLREKNKAKENLLIRKKARNIQGILKIMKSKEKENIFLVTVPMRASSQGESLMEKAN
jgi:hypothetical protein